MVVQRDCKGPRGWGNVLVHKTVAKSHFPIHVLLIRSLHSRKGLIIDNGELISNDEAGEVVTRMRHETRPANNKRWMISVELSMNSTTDKQPRGLVALHAQLHLLEDGETLRSPEGCRSLSYLAQLIVH